MSDFAPLPDPATSPDLLAALRALQAGGAVGYPTETVWGLAALPAHAGVLTRRKGREDAKPLQLSCVSAAAALACAQPSPELLALAAFWPGPLTVVTRARPEVTRRWGEGARWLAPGGRVGLRVPDHALAQALLRLGGGSLATTSLNPSGAPAALTSEQARAYGLADLLLETGLKGGPEAGPAPLGLASTVVLLPEREGEPVRLGRLGALGEADLRRVLAPLGRGVTVGEGA